MSDRPLFAIAEAIDRHTDATLLVADALRALGTGDAATSMGAIEALAVKVNEGLESIAAAIEMKGTG